MFLQKMFNKLGNLIVRFFKSVFKIFRGLAVFVGSIVVLHYIKVAYVFFNPEEKHHRIPEQSVLIVDTSKDLKEKWKPSGFYLNKSFAETMTALEWAISDGRIKHVIVVAPKPPTISHAEEMRKMMIRLRNSGKKVTCYVEEWTTGVYYMASGADTIVSDHHSYATFTGLIVQREYLKDFYSMFGIKFNVYKKENYKTGPDGYNRNEMSKYEKEALESLTSSIVSVIKRGIQEGAGINKNKVEDLLNSGVYTAEDLLVDGYIHKISDYHDLKKSICNELKIDHEKNSIKVHEYYNIRSREINFDKNKCTLIIYMRGAIPTNSKDLSKEEIDVDHYVSLLNNIIKKENIEQVGAVVVRVNSPGGCAYGSEKLFRTICKFKAMNIPVVISMGSYAASGGYVISCSGSYIFANETTITGSIGTYQIRPDISDLLKFVHVHLGEVSTHKNDWIRRGMPIGEDNPKILEQGIEKGYASFLKKVMKARGFENIESTREVAQGRAWSGKEAINKNLVDSIGGINDAIRKAEELYRSNEIYRGKTNTKGTHALKIMIAPDRHFLFALHSLFYQAGISCYKMFMRGVKSAFLKSGKKYSRTYSYCDIKTNMD